MSSRRFIEGYNRRRHAAKGDTSSSSSSSSSSPFSLSSLTRVGCGARGAVVAVVSLGVLALLYGAVAVVVKGTRGGGGGRGAVGRTGHELEKHAVWRVDAHLELDGRVVRWSQQRASSTACQADCDAMEKEPTTTCNVFVFCDAADGCCGSEHGACWLKTRDIRHDGMPATMSRGRGVGWTSGLRVSPAEIDAHAQHERERAAEALAELRQRFPDAESQLDERVCGSPASDAYASVNASCLERSPTAAVFSMARLAAIVDGGGDGAQGWAFDASCNVEEHVSLDGLAVAWGPSNKVDSAAACCDACRRHEVGKGSGPFAKLPCNLWVFCPDDSCFEPDAHAHSRGDCWLKFTELPHRPEVNQRGSMPDSYRARHPNAPIVTHWTSGVLLLPGMDLTNGTWSPRANWR